MTPEAAQAARAGSKDERIERADILTIHLAWWGAAELARMKPTARLINTTRGPIVDEPP